MLISKQIGHTLFWQSTLDIPLTISNLVQLHVIRVLVGLGLGLVE